MFGGRTTVNTTFLAAGKLNKYCEFFLLLAGIVGIDI
jgi:hypothetical protein